MNRADRRAQERNAYRLARKFVSAVSAAYDMPAVEAKPPQWVRDQFDIAIAAMKTGAKNCGHISSPTPVFGAVWQPGMFTCGACSDLLAADPAENDLCDRCRQYSKPIIAAMACMGALTLQFGLCWPCATAIDWPLNAAMVRI